ncbi:LysR family transcriptional regulator [Nocardia tengchongensis]
MDVQTRHLRYFVAVAEELNFTRAAQRLHIAQQALSAQVKQLEQELGVTLLERNTRAVSLTPAGMVYLEDARAILAHLERAGQRAAAMERGSRDRLVLGFTEGAALTLTEPILTAYRARHPVVTVELRQFNYDEPAAGLADCTVDVAFVRLPIATPGLRVRTLFAEPVVVAVPAGHRLAGRPSVRVEDLLDEPILGSATTDPVWNAFWELEAHRNGVPAPVVSRSSTLLEEFMKVASGVGVVVTAAAARWVPHPGVVLVPIADAPPCELAVARPGDVSTPLAESFMEVAVTVSECNRELVALLEMPDYADPSVPGPLGF